MSLQQDRDDLLKVLKKIVDWGRENTSPLDANSPHTLLVEASNLIIHVETPNRETVQERYQRWHREG